MKSSLLKPSFWYVSKRQWSLSALTENGFVSHHCMELGIHICYPVTFLGFECLAANLNLPKTLNNHTSYQYHTRISFKCLEQHEAVVFLSQFIHIFSLPGWLKEGLVIFVEKVSFVFVVDQGICIFKYLLLKLHFLLKFLWFLHK